MATSLYFVDVSPNPTGAVATIPKPNLSAGCRATDL